MHRALKGFAVLAIGLVIYGGGRNAGGGSRFQPLRVRPVGQDEDGLGRIGRVPRRLQDGFHIGAAPGNQDGQFQAGHAGARSPSTTGVSPIRRSWFITISAMSGSTEKTMPMPILKVRCISSSSTPPAS